MQNAVWHHPQSNEVRNMKIDLIVTYLNIYFYRVEEELRLAGDSAEGDASSSRRSSTSARRSFFKRIKPQRGSSRDSKELASFSNTHLSLYLEPAVNDDNLISYQRVERLECKLEDYLCLISNVIKNVFF